MSSKVSPLSYMKLADSRKTFFHFRNERHNVHDCASEVFDAFICQAVEEIKNVDRSKWPIFQRWRIINACLPEDALLLEVQEDETLILKLPEAETSIVEEKASDSEEKASNIPEVGIAYKVNEASGSGEVRELKDVTLYAASAVFVDHSSAGE